MFNKKSVLILILVMMMVLASLAGCAKAPVKEAEAAPVVGTIILATTTSTQDSGLLDVILPAFTFDTGYEVKTIAVGSGKAMQMGIDGEADVLLVHSPAAETAFVADGHGPARFDVMYNDFVILGPNDDPAGILETSGSDAAASFKTIAEKQATFVSRADESGTNAKELKIWETAGITPSGDWYIEAGKGMGDVITMTNEKLGYTLSDRATWLSMKADLDLKILTEGDKALYNQYGVIVVDPGKNDLINAEGALAFQEWILAEKAQTMIGEYGVEEFGQPLFIPNAK